MSSKNKIKVFLITFFLFIILLIVLDFGFLIISRLRVKSIFGTQVYLRHILSGHGNRSSDISVPGLSLVRITDKEYYLKDSYNYYYPEAWGKPGHILFKRRCGKFYFLTFGDGSRATVTNGYFHGDDPNNEAYYIQTTGAEKYNYSTFWIIPLGAITIVLTLFLMKKEETPKKNES